MEKENYRKGLIELYQSQLSDLETEGDYPFMCLVLKEAIRKLVECPSLDAKRIENWVVKLEKDWRNV